MTAADFTIRSLTQDDEMFLWEMLYQALYVAKGQPPFPPEIIQEPGIAGYAEGWGRSGDMGFVALEPFTRRAAGAVWIRLFSAAKPGYGYVNAQTPELSIALLPEFRNQGLGTLLLKRMMAEAGLQFGALSLSVLVENPAVHLYQRMGFIAVSTSGDSQAMMKDLRATGVY